MSNVLLLDKTRKISKLLHNSSSSKVVFNDICNVMKEVLGSETMVISRKGKLLGRSGVTEGNAANKSINTLIPADVGKFIDKSLNERFLSVLSTRENVSLTTLGFDFDGAKAYHGVIVPVDIAGKRLASLFIYKSKGEYDIEDIIVLEYGATVVGLEMLRSVKEEHAEVDRREQMAHSAVDTLSLTERKAIVHILDELKDGEGLLVTSKIADNVGITRSVIVNGLKKLESAGVIECRSAGMKGTYIKVVNDVIYQVAREED